VTLGLFRVVRPSRHLDVTLASAVTPTHLTDTETTRIYVTYIPMVARRKLYSFWIDPDIADRLKRLKKRTGQNESDQIRGAIEAWLDRAEKAGRRAREEGRTRKRHT
jgi:hypothetical protein